MFISSDLRPFFWDIDIAALDADKHKRFIIERILKYGTSKEVRWLLSKYTDEDIIETVKKSKNIGRKTASYWAVHYGIKREDIACLNRQLTQDCFY